MKNNIIVFICAVVILLIICIICLTKSANVSCNKYHYYLSGVWIGDPEFLKKSNLKDLQIFLSPKNKKHRNGYIIMVNINGDIVLNQPIELTEITPAHNQRWLAYNMDKKIKNDNFDIAYLISSNIDPDIFPKNITMSVSIGNGSLIIKNNDNIYALCEKDLISSATAIATYEE